jgi:hypothetical protein
MSNSARSVRPTPNKSPATTGLHGPMPALDLPHNEIVGDERWASVTLRCSAVSRCTAVLHGVSQERRAAGQFPAMPCTDHSSHRLFTLNAFPRCNPWQTTLGRQNSTRVTKRRRTRAQATAHGTPMLWALATPKALPRCTLLVGRRTV